MVKYLFITALGFFMLIRLGRTKATEITAKELVLAVMGTFACAMLLDGLINVPVVLSIITLGYYLSDKITNSSLWACASLVVLASVAAGFVWN